MEPNVVNSAQEAGTQIPWADFHMYNTLMGIAAGVSLLAVVSLVRKLVSEVKVSLDGYALLFGIAGAILAFLGGHMTIQWPLTVVPQANIIFGEGCLAFGTLLLAAAFYLWKLPVRTGGADIRAEELISSMRPVSYFVASIGAGMGAIGVAGVRYELFGAPPEEPITGAFAGAPLVESIFVSSLFFFIALGAVLAPVFVNGMNRLVGAVIAASWSSAGVLWVLFSIMNYYTHIGLIVNTTQSPCSESATSLVLPAL